MDTDHLSSDVNWMTLTTEQKKQLDHAALVARRLAHDYGNILTSILGYCELALTRITPTSPIRRFLEQACLSAQSGAELTERVRFFASNTETSPETTSLMSAFMEEWMHLENKDEVDVELTVDVASDFPSLQISSQCLRLILRELITNARESIKGEGRLTLSARECPAEEIEPEALLVGGGATRYARIVLSDNGRGMTDSDEHALFCTPFYTDKPRRRGYGLAVVYGLLKTHQGGFRFRSATGQGTSVELILPLATAGRSGSSLSQSPRNGLARSDHRILVVDDDPTILKVVLFILEGEGYQVTLASSGDLALEEIERGAPDEFSLVLTDWTMPGISGAQLLKKIFAQRPSLPVVLMSGTITREEAQAHFPDRKLTLLEKPFNPLTLLSTVRRNLNAQVSL